MKKITVFAVFVFVMTLTACDDFFSSSWGEPREYKAENIDVTPGNLDKWVERVVGNPPLAFLVNKDIIKKLKSGSLGAHTGRFMTAGIGIAVESSGLGKSMLTHAMKSLSDLLDDDKADTDMLKDIFGKVQRDFIANKGGEAAKDISTILINSSVTDKGGTPQFNNAYAKSVKPGDAAEAIMVLVLGELGSKNLDEYDWNNVTDLTVGLKKEDGHIKADGSPSDTAIVLAAYLNLIADDDEGRFEDNPLTKTLADSFFDNP